MLMGNEMRHPTRHRGLQAAAALLSLILFRSTDARGQEFKEVFVDPESEIAVLSWDDLGLRDQLGEPERQLVVHDGPDRGALVSLEGGLAYVPHRRFWTAGGDSFVYSFDDAVTSIPSTPVIVLSPYGWLFAEDMESRSAEAWDAKVGQMRHVEAGIDGRSLEVFASSSEDRYLMVDLMSVEGDTNQNTDTKMTIGLDDPARYPPPETYREGHMVIWSVRSPAGIVTRLRLRHAAGRVDLRAENGREPWNLAVTEWLPLAPGAPSDVMIGVEVEGVLALRIEKPGDAPRTSKVADGHAAAVDFRGEHRLGAFEVTGGSLRLLLDDFFAGRTLLEEELIE